MASFSTLPKASTSIRVSSPGEGAGGRGGGWTVISGSAGIASRSGCHGSPDRQTSVSGRRIPFPA